MTVTSPCTGICKLDDTTGWCVGCGRSGDEIAGWGGRTDVSRAQVWDQIPTRLAQLGVACRRLPWTTDETRAFVLRSLKAGHGTWVMGVVGAVAEFTASPGAGVDVTEVGDDIIARTVNGAVRMQIDEDVRAVTFDPPGLHAPPRIVLAVKRERGRLPVADGVSDLGEDDPLLSDTGTRLFDLGLGRKEARFCVRAASGPAMDALDTAIGQPFLRNLPVLGPTLIAESPTRVVETALGRIEVQSVIPTPDAEAGPGPHTHLLPDQLQSGRQLPVGMDLPRSYFPGAIYYPKH